MKRRQELLEYKPVPTIERFHASDALVRIIMGPVGSGKSTGCCWDLFRRMLRQALGPDDLRHSKWVVIRRTYGQLLDTTIPTWLREFGPYGDYHGGHRPWYRFAWEGVEAEVLFRGFETEQDAEDMGSLEVTGAYINELREMPKAILDKLVDRTGRYPTKKMGGVTWRGIVADSNMPDTDHWLYKFGEEMKAKGELPDWEFYKQPGALIEVEGKFVPNPVAENIENLPLGMDYYLKGMQGKTPQQIRVNYCAQYGFEPTGRRVHEEYIDAIHCAPKAFPPIPGLPVYFGQDFGLMPAAAFFQRTPKGQYRVFDEIATEDIGAKRYGELLLLPKLQGELGEFEIAGWGDPGAHRAETDESTAFQILRAMKVPIKPAPTNNPAMRREALAAPLMRMIDGEPGLIISPKCVNLRKGLAEKFVYNRVQVMGDERYHDEPNKNFWSHICEALEYGLMGAGEGRTLVRPAKSAQKADEDRIITRHSSGDYAWMGL